MNYLKAIILARKIIAAYILAMNLIEEAKKDDDKIDTEELFDIIMKVLESISLPEKK